MKKKTDLELKKQREYQRRWRKNHRDRYLKNNRESQRRYRAKIKGNRKIQDDMEE